MFDLRPCSQPDVISLCERYHGYGSGGAYAAYAFGVWEEERIIAAYSWMPPAYGACVSVCPEAPHAVLALSRMVACPKVERKLKHISKPLMVQMKRLIDRGRYPVLVTYSDEGQGHTGYVYQCSGWEKTTAARRAVFVDSLGNRRYSGVSTAGLTRQGYTVIQRWEHWACERGKAGEWMLENGWVREPILGKVWRSGAPAYRFVQR